MDLYRLQVHGYSCLVGGGCAAGFKFNFNAALRPQRPQGVLGTGSLGCPPRLSHCSSSMLLCVHRPQGLLGTGAQDVHLDFHTAAELCCSWVAYWLYCLSPPSPLPPPSAAMLDREGAVRSEGYCYRCCCRLLFSAVQVGLFVFKFVLSGELRLGKIGYFVLVWLVFTRQRWCVQSCHWWRSGKPTD